MDEKLINWLKSKSGYLKIRAIERDLKMPQGTLSRHIQDNRSLADHWKPKIVEWVNNFKK